jgi:hypothetical protein
MLAVLRSRLYSSVQPCKHLGRAKVLHSVHLQHPCLIIASSHKFHFLGIDDKYSLSLQGVLVPTLLAEDIYSLSWYTEVTTVMCFSIRWVDLLLVKPFHQFSEGTILLHADQSRSEELIDRLRPT